MVLFVRNSEIKKVSYPNLSSANDSGLDFLSYSEMYKKSGDTLIHSFDKDKNKYLQDQNIIPSVFLYSHAIELILKAMLLTHYQMNKDMTREKIIEKLHGQGLQQLWNITEKIVQLYLQSSNKKDKKSLKLMSTAIAELVQADTSEMFRNPENTDFIGQKIIGNKKHKYGLDFQALRINFDEVYKHFLDCFYLIYKKYDGLELKPSIS